MKIEKTTGDIVPFSQEKVRKSLVRSGAPLDVARSIVKDVLQERPKTTKEVHKLAFAKLKKKYRPVAARYNLKRAIKELGPSGYPFEQFIAGLLRARGYSVETNKVLKGYCCIRHETDVIAQKDDKYYIFECKFHNRLGTKSDIKTVMYIKARFDDLRAQWENEKRKLPEKQYMWVVTNTMFSKDAISYAECCGGVRLMSWRYPRGKGLADLIDEEGLHPITALTYLSKRHKKILINHGVVLCRQIPKKRELLQQAGIKQDRAKKIVREARAICQLEETM